LLGIKDERILDKLSEMMYHTSIMSEADGFSPEFVEQNGGGFRCMVRSALGRLGAGSEVSVGSEIELYAGDIVPADEVITGELVEGEVVRLPKTARLPEKFIEKDTLGQMEVGKEAYTVPWAMAVTQEGFCFLNGSYTFQRETGGTVQMKVEHTKDGYVVHGPRGYKYNPVKQIPWVGAEGEDLLPVHKVREGRTSY
jgi:hypothetical protein